MERILIQMEDPVFTPGSSKTAVVSIPVSPAGLTCTMELFLGPDPSTKVATSGPVAFTSTGVAQNVTLPLVMPAIESTYHVYIDVIVAGELTGYQATEDVVISTVVPPVNPVIQSFLPVRGHSGAWTDFAAVVQAPKALGAAIAFSIYIPKDLIRAKATYPESYCDQDKVFLSASFAAGDLTAPDDIYTLAAAPGSESTVLCYHWYGKVTATGWAGLTKWLPAGNYPVYGKITVGGVVVSNEQIATLQVVTTSDSLLAYSNVTLHTVYGGSSGNTLYAYLTASITNNGPTARTVELVLWETIYYIYTSYYIVEVVSVTIQPGATYSYTSRQRNINSSPQTYTFWLVDDLGGASVKKSEST